MSVWYWDATDDLRPYFVVQFLPIALIPMMLGAFPAVYRDRGYYIMVAVGLYAAAKVRPTAASFFFVCSPPLFAHSPPPLLLSLASLVPRSPRC